MLLPLQYEKKTEIYSFIYNHRFNCHNYITNDVAT